MHGKDSEKAQLFESDDFISLIITLNKIPEKPKNYKPMPMWVLFSFLFYFFWWSNHLTIYFRPLSHPLHDENIEVCFFVKDPIKQYKEMFDQVGIRPKKVSGFLIQISRFASRSSFDTHTNRFYLLQNWKPNTIPTKLAANCSALMICFCAMRLSATLFQST